MLNYNIRNFSIIAHIDHGKSTLADRMLEITHAINLRERTDCFLDKMDLEKEKGITIKSQTAKLIYYWRNNTFKYTLNLIDTPGHADLQYEIYYYMSACEGILLIVDALQGIEAQTIAHIRLIQQYNMNVIVVINKIDIFYTNLNHLKEKLYKYLDIRLFKILFISAKYGIGIDLVFKNIIKFISPPPQKINIFFFGSILDSWYNNYYGIILLIRVFTGTLSSNQYIKCTDTKKQFCITQVGILTPEKIFVKKLYAGDVGIVLANIKNVKDVSVGSSITHIRINDKESNYSASKIFLQTVYVSIYPLHTYEYKSLKLAIEKLSLNDAALFFESETSLLLGYGYRCGFSGILHMEIIKERIKREFYIKIIITSPTVKYKVLLRNGQDITISNPSNMPDSNNIQKCKECFVEMIIQTPSIFMGSITKLCEKQRGIYTKTEHLNTVSMNIIYLMPLSEIIIDFSDSIKNITKGHAILTYNIIGYKETKITRIDILINKKIIDILSFIAHINKVEIMARKVCQDIKESICKQQFSITIQAAIGKKIIAKEMIPAFRKNVISKCYGGDITRKKKLLSKQKKGKEKLKKFGNLELSKNFFFGILGKLDK